MNSVGELTAKAEDKRSLLTSVGELTAPGQRTIDGHKEAETEMSSLPDFVGLRLDRTGNRANGYFGQVQSLLTMGK